MPEAADTYEEILSRGAESEKQVIDEQLAERRRSTQEDVSKLERLQAEQKPEWERFKQKQAGLETVQPPMLEKPPQVPQTQEMLKPTSLQQTVGMASIFALLSVGIAKGSAIYGLKALGGFLEGAHAGNVEQAEAALKDFNSNMKRVHDANEYARQSYLDVFNNKKYTLEMQEHAVHLKALEMKDELMVQARREKGMTGVHDLIRQRADVDHKFGAEMQRYRQWENTIRHQKAMEAKTGAGGVGGTTDSIFGIPMADIPVASPGQKNEEFLKMLSPAQAEIVKRVASNDIDLKTFGGMGREASANRVNYGRAAIIYDPNYKTRQAGILEKAEKELTPGGRVGTNTLAINTLPHHVDQFMESYKKLNNSQVQRWNSAKNKFQTEFGDPRLENTQVSAYVVAEELARVAKGGMASPIKDEVERFLIIFNTSASPQQAMGKAWEVLQIAGGRLNAVEESYRLQGMNKRVLTSEARELILKYKPKNVPTPDWLRGGKGSAGDLSELEKQAEMTPERKAELSRQVRDRVGAALPRARNPQTGQEWELRNGEWQLLPKR